MLPRLQAQRNDRHPVRIRRQIQQGAHLPGRGRVWNSNATLRPILDHLLQRAGLLPVRMQIGLANGGVPNTISISNALAQQVMT